jgi:hypothetical protein
VECHLFPRQNRSIRLGQILRYRISTTSELYECIVVRNTRDQPQFFFSWGMGLGGFLLSLSPHLNAPTKRNGAGCAQMLTSTTYSITLSIGLRSSRSVQTRRHQQKVISALSTDYLAPCSHDTAMTRPTIKHTGVQLDRTLAFMYLAGSSLAMAPCLWMQLFRSVWKVTQSPSSLSVRSNGSSARLSQKLITIVLSGIFPQQDSEVKERMREEWDPENEHRCQL